MISAVAQKYNIHPQTLRLYEREGLLKPSRTEGNTRLYSEEDLEQLETILSLTRDLGVNLAGVEIILNMRRKIEQMQGEVNEFMEYVKRELARGIGDWEQRLSTALVKSSPTDLVRATPPPTTRRQPRIDSSRSDSAADIRYVASRSVDLPNPRSMHALPALRRHRLEAGRTTTACGASCAATAGASSVGQQRLADAHIPQALSALHDRELHRLQRVARARGRQARAARRTRFPSVEQGAVPRGQPGVGKTHLAVAVLKQVIQTTGRARPLLRHARSAAGHPQHLRPVDPHDRARGAAAGHDGRPARPRRSRRREDLRMGRGDDEPDRQHALQRAAADDLHVELRGHSRRHRSELAAVPHRPPDAVAPARDVRVPRSWTAPTIASCRSTAASTI